MFTDCLHTQINDIQCKFADLAYKHSEALSIGRTCDDRAMYIKVIASYLELLYCYKTFDAQVTYATSFVFGKNDDTSITIEITVGSDTFTYTGTGNQLEISQYFLNQFLNSTNYSFNGFIHKGTLYIYSYDTNLNFNTTTVVETQDITVTTNMEDTYNTILDIWNCVTSDQVCTIINHAKKLTGQCNCH